MTMDKMFLKSSFKTGSSSSPCYCHIFFLFAFLEEAFIRNIIIIICINDNNVVINPLNAELNPICYLLALLGAHHFLHVSRLIIIIEHSKTLFCSSRFPWAHERISLIFIDNFVICPQKGLPDLT